MGNQDGEAEDRGVAQAQRAEACQGSAAACAARRGQRLPQVPRRSPRVPRLARRPQHKAQLPRKAVGPAAWLRVQLRPPAVRPRPGAKRNMAERQGRKMRLMMAQHPMSPLTWRAVLAGLQDLVRQIGPPQHNWTFAPRELSFPYSEFLLDELRKQLRSPAHETLHIARCMLEAVRGFVARHAGRQDNVVASPPAASMSSRVWSSKMAARRRARSATMAVAGRTCTCSSGWMAQSGKRGRCP